MKSALEVPQRTSKAESLPGSPPNSRSGWTTTAAAIPWRAIAIIVLAIFLGEMLVMFGLNWADATQPIFGLLDAFVVTLLTFVLLQRFVLSPMTRNNERLQAEVADHEQTAAELKVQTTALEAAAHGVMITDVHGRIQWVNPAFTDMTGYAPAEIYGQTPGFLTSGDHDNAYYADLWKTILSGAVWRGEMTNRRKDGTLYIEEQTITPVYGNGGGITHFIAVKNDCSERKRTADELAARNEQLLRLSEMERHQRQFAEALATAAHSLNVSLELDEVLDAILEQAQAMIPARAAVVMLLRGDWIDVVRHRDATGRSNALSDGFPLDHFPGFRSMIEDRTGQLVIDTRVEPEWTDIPGLEWIRSLGVVPLVENNRVTGFLAVVCEQAEFIDQETVDYLTAFAAQAAVALQNARLYHAERYARHTAETLAAASLDLTRSLNLQAVLDSLLRHLKELVDYDGAHVALLTDETHLIVKAAAGDDPWADLGSSEASLIEIADCAELQGILGEQFGARRDNTRPGDTSSYFARLAAWKSWLGVPIVVGDKVVGLCGIEKRVEEFFTTEHLRLAEVMIAQAAVAIQNASLFEQVQSGSERLQLLSHRLVQVQENERKIVARELHDQAGQVLTSLKIGLRQLGHEIDDPKALETRIDELSEVTDSVFDDLHRLALNLRPATLDHLGLVIAIGDHVANLNQQHELQIRFETVGVDENERLEADLETALYRITQESLTNVIRHAGAAQVDLLLHFDPHNVRLTIEDDGVGFDPQLAMQSSQMGLLGMRERCEMLGGRLEVESAPGAGTTLVAELPRIVIECHDQ